MQDKIDREKEREELKDFKKQVREAIAEYMATEGCSCCRDVEGHDKNKEVLAKMLNVKKYSDGSGYDFSKHRRKKK